MIVTAPGGWGWKPGTMIAGDVSDVLPDLPVLSMVVTGARVATLAQALRSVPGLATLARPCELQRRYGIPQATASDAIQAARRAA